MKGRPITPREVVAKKTETIPPEVFDAFNELIAEGWNGHHAVVMQVHVVKRIHEKLPDVSTATFFDRGWMDVEPSYRRAGWSVAYDKPGYCETYEPSYTFKRKR